ncbi:MAG TPA: alpha/beta hydrolase [Pirellulales bacterium]|jgi:hypothetical protein|nr:alpha/beta hydrolase [Pirellulales bacterium]
MAAEPLSPDPLIPPERSSASEPTTTPAASPPPLPPGGPAVKLKRRTSLGVRLVRIVLLSYCGMLVAAMFMENSLVYFPSKYPEGDWQPADFALEDLWMTTGDGVKIHGWYIPCEQPRAYLLFAHGNAGNITYRVELMRRLHQLHVATLFFDYRGYGRSDGSPNETGVLFDARAARKALAEKAGLPEDRLIMMGESLGGGVAVNLAAQDGARALILENTFTSAPDVAAKHYPFLPCKLLMRNRFNSLAIIGQYHGPLLQFHGDADTIVPYALGEQLFAAANEPKTFVTIPHGDHNDDRTPKFYEGLAEFLEKLP